MASRRNSLMIREVDIPSKWTSTEEKFLRRHANICGAYVWMHNQIASYFSYMDWFLSIVQVGISMAATSGPVSTLANNSDPTSWQSILMAIIALSVSLVEGIRRVMRLPTHISNHRSAATKYAAIYNKIARELYHSRSARLDARMFLDNVLDDIGEAFHVTPPIWGFVIYLYVKKFGKVTKLTKIDLTNIYHIEERHRRGLELSGDTPRDDTSIVSSNNNATSPRTDNVDDSGDNKTTSSSSSSSSESDIEAQMPTPRPLRKSSIGQDDEDKPTKTPRSIGLPKISHNVMYDLEVYYV